MSVQFRRGKHDRLQLHILTDGDVTEEQAGKGLWRGSVASWTCLVVYTVKAPRKGERGAVRRRLYVLEPAEGVDAVTVHRGDLEGLFVEGGLRYAWHTNSGREAEQLWRQLRDFEQVTLAGVLAVVHKK